MDSLRKALRSVAKKRKCWEPSLEPIQEEDSEETLKPRKSSLKLIQEEEDEGDWISISISISIPIPIPEDEDDWIPIAGVHQIINNRENAYKDSKSHKKFQEEQKKDIKNRGGKPKWHHLLTKMDDKCLYLKLKAPLDKRAQIISVSI